MPEIPHEGDHREGLAVPTNVVDMPAAKPVSKFKPYGEYIHIEWNELTQVGRIILPNRLENGIAGRANSTGSFDWRRAKVIACGDDCKLVEVGDFILLAPEGVVPVNFEDERYWFTKESVILAVVE